jgi:serine/threonine-protein kinase
VKLDQAYSTSVPVGDVISQDPSAHEMVPIGSKVHLVISLGPKTFAMPSVIGLPSASAQAQLGALGLDVSVVTIPGAVGDTVVGQKPDGDTTVEQGQSVTIYVA